MSTAPGLHPRHGGGFASLLAYSGMDSAWQKNVYPSQKVTSTWSVPFRCSFEMGCVCGSTAPCYSLPSLGARPGPILFLAATAVIKKSGLANSPEPECRRKETGSEKHEIK